MDTKKPTTFPWFELGLLLLIGVIYGQILWASPLLEYDDATLIGSLQNIHSLESWWAHYADRRAFDLQPLRDLSYLFDRWLEGLLGFQTYHLTNVFLYFFTSVFLYRLCMSLSLHRTVARLITIVFLVHPIHVEVVAWISGRKFLLSALLIVAATHCCIVFKKALTGGHLPRQWLVPLIVFFYVGSLLSQPVTLFFPLWVILYFYPHRHRVSVQSLIGCLFFLCLIFTALNLSYYSESYVNQRGATKWLEPSLYSGLAAMLSAGRAFFNLIIPFRLSILYASDSPWNDVGLGLFIPLLLWVGFSLRSHQSRNTRTLFQRPETLWIVWAMFLYIPVSNLLPTNVFLADRYLYMPSIGLLVFLGVLVSRMGQYGGGIAKGCAATLIVTFALQSSIRAEQWTSDRRLILAARDVEPYWQTYLWAGHLAFKEGNFPLAQSEFALVEEEYPEAPLLSRRLTALALVRHPSDIDEELLRIHRLRPQSPFPLWELAHRHSGDKKFQLLLHAFTATEPMLSTESERLRIDLVTSCKEQNCSFGQILATRQSRQELRKQLAPFITKNSTQAPLP